MISAKSSTCILFSIPFPFFFPRECRLVSQTKEGLLGFDGVVRSLTCSYFMHGEKNQSCYASTSYPYTGSGWVECFSNSLNMSDGCKYGMQFSVYIKLLKFNSSAAAFHVHPNTWTEEYCLKKCIWQASHKHLFPLLAPC